MIPVKLHSNNHPHAQRVFWSGCDSETLWRQNMTTHRAYFESMSWHTPESIVYDYNSHGFRDHEFDQRPAWLALGCSLTEGVGLEQHQIWPTMLSQTLRQHVWNLGVGGGALDTCYRVLYHYIDQLNCQGVVLLCPNIHRFELFNPSGPQVFLPDHTRTAAEENIYRYVITSDENFIVNREKNLLAMQQLCSKSRIPFITMFQDRIWPRMVGITERARDLSHPGPTFQKFVVEEILKTL